MDKAEAELGKLLWLRGRVLAQNAKSALEECFRVYTGDCDPDSPEPVLEEMVYKTMQMSLFTKRESSAPTPVGARSYKRKERSLLLTE